MPLPEPPTSEIDPLVSYLSGPFVEHKREFLDKLSEAKQLSDRGLVAELGYEVLLFRAEIDEWLNYSKSVFDNRRGAKMAIAQSERASEALEKSGSKRPSAKLVDAQVAEELSPLQRALDELTSTRELLISTLSFIQSQMKLIASDEWGELAVGRHAASESAKERALGAVSPPDPSVALKRLRD